MGDYVHASITICGHIAAIEAFDDLLNALENKYLRPASGGESRDSLRHEFVSSLVKGESAYFECDQVNYGNLSEVTDVCQEYGIAYERTSDAAGDSDAEEACWYPGDKDEFGKEDAAVDGWQLEKLLDEPDLEVAVKAKVAQLKRASGKDLPTLSISDELRDHLAVEIGRARVAA
ncbi:MAG: hypothetical protein J0I99_00540 [Devosia sp.]|uniref:hypothetical protein n=1 Tax=Devosia sp. TaxID=1871048 RepID=UPI001AD48995|nr:hypothetical protein [Devosia sp.]MBN9310851.1 hypothetical protein [Devosia sp.]MBN9314204.1 hypothetical protein [Devosia sp.]